MSFEHPKALNPFTTTAEKLRNAPSIFLKKLPTSIPAKVKGIIGQTWATSLPPLPVMAMRNCNKTEGRSILFHAVFAQLPVLTGPHPWLAQWHCHLVFSDVGNFGGDRQKKTDYTWQTMKCKSRGNSSLQILPSSRLQSEFIFTEFLWRRSHISHVTVVSEMHERLSSKTLMNPNPQDSQFKTAETLLFKYKIQNPHVF